PSSRPARALAESVAGATPARRAVSAGLLTGITGATVNAGLPPGRLHPRCRPRAQPWPPCPPGGGLPRDARVYGTLAGKPYEQSGPASGGQRGPSLRSAERVS